MRSSYANNPTFEKLYYAKLFTSEHPEVAQAVPVESVPIFVFLVDGQVKGQASTLKDLGLEAIIRKAAAPAARQDHVSARREGYEDELTYGLIA